MDIIRYKISSYNKLRIGYTGEHLRRKVIFEDYQMVDETNLLMMVLDTGLERKYIPLLNYSFVVDYTISQYEGTLQGQLVEFEIQNGDTLEELIEKMQDDEPFEAAMVGKSSIFNILLQGSIPLDGHLDAITPSFELWITYCVEIFNKLNDLADKVTAKLNELQNYDYTEIREELSEKAKIYKLYFDGDAIYPSYEAWERSWEQDYRMTFQQIYDLCYEKNNFVYIGDGQFKYYPQLDLNVPTRPSEAIVFMSSAQLEEKNFHTRVIINSNNEVKTDQIIDAPMSEISRLNTRIKNLEDAFANFVSGMLEN